MHPYRMVELTTVTVTRKGQAQLPLDWRREQGLEDGGPCDARPVNDGKGSLLLTPRPKRQGAKGLADFLLSVDVAFPPVERHTLPAK